MAACGLKGEGRHLREIAAHKSSGKVRNQGWGRTLTSDGAGVHKETFALWQRGSALVPQAGCGRFSCICAYFANAFLITTDSSLLSRLFNSRISRSKSFLTII